MKKTLIILWMNLVIFTGFSQVLIPQGDTWKYLDNGSDQGTAWKEVTFDDTSWSAGAAQLGFGDGDETTTITSGHITYYFRKSINVTDPAVQNGLKISLLRDDGAIVYINGTEVVRSNMPTGTVTSSTHAAHTVAGADEDTFFEYMIPSDILVAGNNVVAVEVHQRSSGSSDVSFDLQLEFIDYTVTAFRKNPYVLYPGVNSEILLVWQLSQTETCQLVWGTDTTYADGSYTTNEYGNDHQHKYQITGLTPGTKYYYKVSCNGSDFESDFIAGANDSDTAFTFYAYGDTRSQPAEHDGVAEQILTEISNDPASQTFIVNSGDLVANGDDEYDWDNQFFSPQYTHINEMLSRLPYLSAVGNHEGNGILFAKYFPYPMFAGTGVDAYYSFDYANVHFIVIDQFVNYSSGSTQYNWIVNDLQNTTKPWKIAMFHKPGWSAGGHDNNTDVQNILQPLFEQYGVSLVLNGHNHYYSRAVVNNIQHITTGGGGAPLYPPSATYPDIVTVDQSYHFLKISITDDQNMTIKAIRQDGSEIETVDVVNLNGSAIESLEKYHIKVYAFDKSIKINSPYANLEIQIFDLTGRTILKSTLNKGNNSFDVKNQGVYILRIKMPNNNTLIKKISVK